MRRVALIALALAAAAPAGAQSMIPRAVERAPAPAEAGPRLLPNSFTNPPPVMASAGRPSGPADLAYGAYQRGFYVTAFREATARLERDATDAAAMTLLGELCNQGLGVRRDAEQAAGWYRLAAGRGDPRAMASLGLMAADGRGVPRDPDAARRWFETAAAAGEPTAAYNLALLLLASGTEADIRRAFGLLTLAAEAELGDAQHDLGVLYAQGRGVARDRAKAAHLYLRSIKNGSIAGEVEYAIALANGDGVPRDEAFAAIVFRRAALRGNAIAQNRLARLYATGRGLSRNLVEAAAWHLVASGQGLPDAWLDGKMNELPQPDRARAEELAALRAGTL